MNMIPSKFDASRLIRRPFENIPKLWEEFEEQFPMISDGGSGLSLSEDDNQVYIEAHLPGIKADEIKMSIENGVLWIRGEKKDEKIDKDKKFYCKATSSFSYRVAMPQEVNEDKPEAALKEGIMRIAFKKRQKTKAKEISFKS